MRLKLAVLADYASVAEGGKLNIMGIFSNIWARNAPITHAQMFLVVQFEFDFLEEGQKQLRVALVDEDAKELVSVNGRVDVPQGGFDRPTANQIFVFHNTTFPKFGDYEFQVLVDGEVQAQVPVRVMEMKERVA